jgi:hypothetical protein
MMSLLSPTRQHGPPSLARRAQGKCKPERTSAMTYAPRGVRFMLGRLVLALVLFGGMAGASAQEPNGRIGEAVPRDVREAQARRRAEQEEILAIQHAQEAERLAIQQRMLAVQAAKEDELLAVQARVQQLWTDEQFERQVFRQDGNAARARQRLLSQLAMQIETIDRACRLTDAQKNKLQLAGRGDIKRFFDRYEKAKVKSQLIEQDEQNFQEIWQNINQIQQDFNRVTLQGGLFRQNSLLVKSLLNTLTGEQFTRYEVLDREQRASRHRASIATAVAILQRGVSLRDAQRRELITLMTNETKPSRSSGPYDSYVLLWQLARLPEDKLKPLFDKTQWNMVNQQLAQFKDLELTLKQSGQLPDEEDLDYTVSDRKK